MPTVYIIEDQTFLREMLCTLVQDMKMYTLLGSNGDGRLGAEDCLRLHPDLVIVDIMLPGLNGMEIMHQLKAANPRTRFLVFSAFFKRENVQAVIQAGANAVIHKNASISEFEQGIAKAAAGESYMSGDIVDILRDIMLNPGQTSGLAGLTPREREVLQGIAEGYTTKEIAGRLGVSIKTVDTHRSNVMNKLDIHDIAGLTRFAIQHGLIATEPA
jgi:DNA-binding NarL/FixJ family response regulator